MDIGVFIKHCCRIVYEEVDPILFTDQIYEERLTVLQKIIARVLEKDTEFFRILEIGSWNGQSAIFWAESLVSAGKKGNVFCVDPWMAFNNAEEQDDINTNTSRMSRFAEQDRVFPLFWDNIKTKKLTDIVIPLRGRSETILPCLREKWFDLIFIDGSHTYTDFVSDLRLSEPLLKHGGILCGDDLELYSDEIDIPYALEKREKDFITDPLTGKNFHPGITLGIHAYFKWWKIQSCSGVWYVEKNQMGWKDVTL